MIGHHSRLRDMMGQSCPIYACSSAIKGDLNCATDLAGFKFFMLKHQVGRPIGSWSPHGLSLLALPEHYIVLNIQDRKSVV